MDDNAANLIARLLAHRWLPRTDPDARLALVDETFRRDLDQRLAACGLELLENPYADHIALAIRRPQQVAVFGSEDAWLSSNLGLPRDAIALLVILWILIVLPKRQRQVERETNARAQADLFALDSPIPSAATAAPVIPDRTLIADFGDKLGGKTRIGINLGLLARHGFIHRRSGEIAEGPLLDLVFDYPTLAGRIMDGCLKDLLRERGEAKQAPDV
jgi:hypothetical protein